MASYDKARIAYDSQREMVEKNKSNNKNKTTKNILTSFIKCGVSIFILQSFFCALCGMTVDCFVPFAFNSTFSELVQNTNSH